MNNSTNPILLDGRLVASDIQDRIKKEIEVLKEKTGEIPGLSVIIVGDDPASKTYVNSKSKKASKLGIRSEVIEFASDVYKDTIINKIRELNENNLVDAILVQLPLPSNYNKWEVLDHLRPEKDVDCFHPLNLGMVFLNRADIFPCTPSGVLKILDFYKIDISGKQVVVIGRSLIVGKPMAAMLTNRNATVTVCHSKTKDLSGILQQADMIVSAIGNPGFVTEQMIKEKVILVDVGMNYLKREEDVIKYCIESQQKKFAKKGYAITGDISIYAYKKSSYYTPVPGGVGPMTVTMLIYNTLRLFKKRRGITDVRF